MDNFTSTLLTTLNDNVLLKAAVVDLGIQWIGFAISMLLKTEKFYDLTGSATNLFLAWATLFWARNDVSVWSIRQIVQTSCVSVWALRLGAYLFSRVLSSGEDRRFRTAKEKPFVMLIYWTLQAVWIWVTLWPTMIVNSTTIDEPLTLKDYIGYGIFVVGFLIEIIADQQKTSFRSISQNKDKYISSGLWSLSRHPNYFGEILLWIGLFLPASTVIRGYQWASVVSPFLIGLLITKVSGIPILERYADKKWGGSSEYQKYKATTAKLIPFIW